MSITFHVCLFALGVIVGMTVGAKLQAIEDKKMCNQCWTDMYEGSWTLTVDGKDYRMLPMWEPKKEETT